MTHKYLYFHQSIFSPLPHVLGSEKEKPTLGDESDKYKRHSEGLTWYDFYKQEFDAWLSQCKQYPIAKGHQEKFIKFVLSGIAKTKGIKDYYVTEFSLAYANKVNEGVLIPSDNVKIEPDYSPLSNQANVFEDVKYFAFFIASPKTEETPDDPLRYPSKMFREEQLKKRSEFHEQIKAAFVLETSVCFYLTRPQPTEKEMSWLAWTFPNSKIEKGSDQGAPYCTITPKF